MTIITIVTDLLPFHLTAQNLIRAFFLSIATLIILIDAIPQLRSRFLAYGARAQHRTHDTKNATLLDRLAALHIPKRHFLHFYALSVASSLIWTYQLFTRSSLVVSLACPRPCSSGPASRSLTIWAQLLFLRQGVTRLREEWTSQRRHPSASTMHVGHWVYGMLFYAAMGMAVWAEGDVEGRCAGSTEASLDRRDAAISIFGTAIFVAGSVVQGRAHSMLTSLRSDGYKVPPRVWPFNLFLCPHYTGECLIYLGLTLLTAPKALLFNRTVGAGLLLTVVNLRITAKGTRIMYEEKYGKEAVKGRWNMLPFDA